MIPGMPMPSISAGGGGPSGASATNSVMTPFSNPFMFDNSGWAVNIRGTATQSPTGSTGAQNGQPGMFGSGISLPMVAMALGVWLLLKH